MVISNIHGMNSLSHMSRTKKAVFTAFLLLFVAGIALIISELTNRTDLIHMPGRQTKPVLSGPSQKEKAAQAKVDAESKQQYLDKAKSQSQTQPPPPAATSTSLNLTPSQSGTTVTILTKIQGVSSGSCTLTITNDSKSTEQTAQIIYQPEFSSCAGFSVPVGSLGAGTWNIAVKVTPGTGEVVEQSTSLEVR